MTPTANLVLRVDVRMGELGLVFALRVVSAPRVHVCAHVERVNVVAVRNHLREEDASAAVPSSYNNPVY